MEGDSEGMNDDRLVQQAYEDDRKETQRKDNFRYVAIHDYDRYSKIVFCIIDTVRPCMYSEAS